MRKVAMILIGNIRYDGRVQKEIKTFLKNKYEVTLYVSDFDVDDSLENYNYKICVIENHLKKIKFLKRNKFLKKISLKLQRINLLNIILFDFEVLRKLKKLKPDYIHCNDLPTLLFCRFFPKNSKIVFDAHELFPESGESKIKIKLWNLVEKMNIKYTHRIIQAEKNRLAYFMRKHKVNNLELIENFPLRIPRLGNDYFKKKYKYETKNKIGLYIGVIFENRGIEEIIKAVLAFDNLDLFIIGKFSSVDYEIYLKSYINNNNLGDKIIIKPQIPQKEVIKAINSADINFIFYRNNNLNNYYCASNKLYEGLNCGVKVLTNNYPGIKKVAKDLANVRMVKNLKDGEIRAGIKYLMNIKVGTKTKYYWENQENKFMNIYK